MITLSTNVVYTTHSEDHYLSVTQPDAEGFFMARYLPFNKPAPDELCRINVADLKIWFMKDREGKSPFDRHLEEEIGERLHTEERSV